MSLIILNEDIYQLGFKQYIVYLYFQHIQCLVVQSLSLYVRLNIISTILCD